MRMAMLLMLLLPVAVSLAGENLVRNPAFGDGLKYWKVTFPEPNETKYARNHEHCSVVANPGGPGRALLFTIPAPVAASEGVKAATELIRIDPEKSYEFGAEVRTSGTEAIIFIEGYAEDPEQTEKGSDQYEGFVRRYRAPLFCRHDTGGNTDKWVRSRRVIHPWQRAARHQPTHLLVKLYAFHPAGTVYWRNVFLREVPRPDTVPANER